MNVKRPKVVFVAADAQGNIKKIDGVNRRIYENEKYLKRMVIYHNSNHPDDQYHIERYWIVKEVPCFEDKK